MKPPLFIVPRKKEAEATDCLVVAIKLGRVLVIFARSASESTQGEMIADAFEELMSRDQILALAKKKVEEAV